MIKIDVSGVIPRRLGTYLLGIIPGLLFELSLALGDPQLARAMIDRARQVYPFSPWVLAALFVASAFVVGQTFFFLSWFADVFLGIAYRLKRYLVRVTFGSWWMYKAFCKRQGMPPKQNIFIRSLSWAISRAREEKHSSEIGSVLRCWDAAATRLLKRRYGISRSRHLQLNPHEWEVWYQVLGKPISEFHEALMGMRTFLACGFAEFAALYISHALRNRYFIAVAIVFTASGCLQLFELAKWKQDRLRNGFVHLRSVLLELRDLDNSDKDKKDATPDKGLELAIKADGGGEGGEN